MSLAKKVLSTLKSESQAPALLIVKSDLLLYLKELQTQPNILVRRLIGELLLLALIIALVSCGRDHVIDAPPIDASGQTDDIELREFLAKLHAEAVGESRSGIHRGRLAMAYDANGFSEASIQSYAQAAQLDPSDMRWPYLQALSVAETGRIDEAVELLEIANQRDSTYMPSHLAQAYWLLDIGNFEQACSTFQKIQDATTDSRYVIPMQLGFAQCRLELGDVTGASHVVESIGESDLSAYGLLVRARVRRATGIMNPNDTNVSSPESSGSRQTWPDPVAGEVVAYTRGLSGESLLAEKLIEGGRALDAIPLITSLQRRYPQKSALVELHGAALIELRRTDEAIEVLRAGLTKFPAAPLLHFNLGILLEEKAKIDEALSRYVEAIELEPDFVPAYDAQANLLISQGKTQSAIILLESSLNHRSPNASTYNLLGVLYGGEGDWEKSVEYLTEALALDQTNAAILASLALSLSQLNRVEDALEAIERAREMAPADPKVHRAIATLIANGVLATD